MQNELANSSDELRLPREPVDAIVEPVVRFMHVEAASGIVLLACTVFALVLANSAAGDAYLAFWNTVVTFQIGAFVIHHTIAEWINDGLMAVFFFVVGLEVKRELVLGELRDTRRAALPIAAAIGGMVVPASIYLALQWNEPTVHGWGIPMATDIAFVVGCLALLGSRVPHRLRVILLSLAIADDIGAILVIAVGYTEHLHLTWLAGGLIGIGLVSVFARLGVRSILFYVVLGFGIWFCFLESGVHATIAGVILGLMTPASRYLSKGHLQQMLARADVVLHGDWDAIPDRATRLRALRLAARESLSPVEYLEHTLHPWVGFLIMPVFALANAGVRLDASQVSSGVAVAVMLGLVIGKPVGILLSSWLVVKLGIARLPEGISWGVMAGGGCLAGIGFTMALFIASLALEGDVLDTAKVGVLCGSAVSGVLGSALLLLLLPRPKSGGEGI